MSTSQLIQQARMMLIAALLVVGIMAIPVLAGVSTGGVFGVKEASAATQLGGLNLNGYCIAHYNGSSAVLVPPYNAGSWRCQTVTATVSGGLPWGVNASYSVTDYQIDTNAACRWQYGSGAWSSTNNWSDPYSWKCYR